MSARIKGPSYPFGADGPAVLQRIEEERPNGPVSQWPHLLINPSLLANGPKEKFSPSQIETAWGCEASWGYSYLWGLKTRDYTFAEIKAGLGTSRDRSLAFGKALHKDAEHYFTTGLIDLSTEHGRAFSAGTGLVPHPMQGLSLIEIELGLQNLDTRKISAGIEPIEFDGFKDLVLYDNRGLPALYDWKSTKDFKWKKTPEQLRLDLAASMYGLDVMLGAELEKLASRWIYFKSVGKPDAKPTDFVLEKSQCKEIVNGAIITAAQLRSHIRNRVSPEDLDKNSNRCSAYGGCPYGSKQGGPCTGDNRPFLLGQSLAAMSPSLLKQIGRTEYMSETIVERKIREAKEAREAQGQQAPPVGAPPQGFAPPPAGGYIVPPGAPAAQPQVPGYPPPAAAGYTPGAPPAPQYAPPPMPPAPAAPPPPAPVQSHVLPPEAQHPGAAQPPLPPPPPALPAAPANTRKPRGPNKPKPGASAPEGSDEIEVSSQTTVAIAAGSTTILVTSETAAEANGMAELILGLLR